MPSALAVRRLDIHDYLVLPDVSVFVSSSAPVNSHLPAVLLLGRSWASFRLSKCKGR